MWPRLPSVRLPFVSLEKHPGSVSLCYWVASSLQLVEFPRHKAAELYSEPVPEMQRRFFFFLIEVTFI